MRASASSDLGDLGCFLARRSARDFNRRLWALPAAARHGQARLPLFAQRCLGRRPDPAIRMGRTNPPCDPPFECRRSALRESFLGRSGEESLFCPRLSRTAHPGHSGAGHCRGHNRHSGRPERSGDRANREGGQIRWTPSPSIAVPGPSRPGLIEASTWAARSAARTSLPGSFTRPH